MPEYHFRLSITRDDALKFIPAYLKKYPLKKYIFSFEKSKEDVDHIHGHLIYEDTYTFVRSTWHDQIKKMVADLDIKPLKKQQFKYHQEADDAQKSLLYTAKELDIIKHNYSEQEYNDLLEKTNNINANKKLKSEQKLLEEVKQQLSQYVVKKVNKKYDVSTDKYIEETTTEQTITMRDIAKIIRRTYTIKWNKRPPSNTLMKTAQIYIADQLDICQDEADDAYNSNF